ncbi:hypothetical protein FOXB_02146 [Fusarium oxysporum f. sp. conglutinans Fo5176]|uniref:Uncharacterized protein n=1 Tax=Fusarium oxysporum (strain Fo5176) TaxID=660025 RepID=F9F6X1_FUSOF|nr:hypothetical protein FOXB_02146 [Fusarium oxysporum f. sp. conglutinans Fo5176]
MGDKLSRIAKVSLKRGLPPCEDEDLEPQRKIPASGSRASRNRIGVGSQYNGHVFQSEFKTRKTELRRALKLLAEPADTTDVDPTRIDAAKQILINNGIDPLTLHPQRLQNFACVPPAAHQRSIATYSANLQAFRVASPAPQTAISTNAINATISKDNTSGDKTWGSLPPN